MLHYFPGMLTDHRLWQHPLPLLQPLTEAKVETIAHHDRISALAEDFLAHSAHRFALCGLSMGGYTALEICRQLLERGQINRLRYLILIATSARADTAEQAKTRRGLLQLAEKGRFKGVTPKLLPTLIHPSRVEEAELASLIMQMAEDAGQQVFIRQEKAVMHRRSQLDILLHIPCPVLILCGDHDLRTPFECSEEMHRLLPHARLHKLKYCGHLPPLERPEETTRLMRDFIQSVTS